MVEHTTENRGVPGSNPGLAIRCAILRPAALAAVLAALTVAAPARAEGACAALPWHPDMRAAIAFARHRHGDIAFAVRFSGRLYAYRPDHREWSASVLKAMLLVAYLERPGVAHRALTGRERARRPR